MNHKVRVGSGQRLVTLTDKQYKAAGGEGSIYVSNGVAFKIYHDPKKMLPLAKIKELSSIHSDRVIKPEQVLYAADTGEAVGYCTRFVDSAFALVRLLTKTFKLENSVDPPMVSALVKQMQEVVASVHQDKCLIVDLNELNVLLQLENLTLESWFIDTDSYGTPTFPGTAIMDSVRDRRVSKVSKTGELHYAADELSDWFSWGVLAFWAYTNIHPFQGNHPKYKPREKSKQMDDGISVFHPGVRLPPIVNDFNIIPRRHLDWFKAVFLKGERSVPPMPDVSAPLAVPAHIVTITGTDKLLVSQVVSLPEPILQVFQFMGSNYVVTTTRLYEGDRPVYAYGRNMTALLCAANNGTVVSAIRSANRITFRNLQTSEEIGSVISSGMFARNNHIYAVCNGKLVQNSFAEFNHKIIHRVREVENVSAYTATVYDGCVIQDLLGKKYLTLPYATDRSFSKYIPALDGFRVINAKSDKTVTAILAERKGVYHRFVVVFDQNYASFKVREVKDVPYDEINFTVIYHSVRNVCLLLASPAELEIFSEIDKTEVIENPPFDSSMPLFSNLSGTFFINGNSVHQIHRR